MNIEYYLILHDGKSICGYIQGGTKTKVWWWNDIAGAMLLWEFITGGEKKRREILKLPPDHQSMTFWKTINHSYKYKIRFSWMLFLYIYTETLIVCTKTIFYFRMI
jgi:hypothetical protein